MTLTVLLPIRTKNPLNGQMANSRLAAVIAKRERASQRSTARALVVAELRHLGISPAALLPCIVTLTRISTGTMDTDGLAASQKGVRDGIAAALGIDDGSRFVKWRYRQQKGKRGEHAVECTIEKGVFRRDI